jgi:hypothetical protein
MPVYRVSGLAFRSAFVFPELRPVARAVPQVRVALARTPRVVAPRWFHRWRGRDGRDWARFARLADGYLVRFPGLADFWVSRAADQVRCAPRPSVPADVLRHLFLHQVWPLVLGERGRVVLHASAVATPAGAVVFLGDAGRGKSTLAASFWTAGCALVADDSVRLDHRGDALVVVPSYPGVRLRPRALRGLPLGSGGVRPRTAEKVLVAPEVAGCRVARAAVPLARLYVLAPAPASRTPAAAALEPLSARETMAELVAHRYRLDPSCRAALAREFEQLAAIAEQISARRLRLRRGLQHLDEVRKVIFADLGTLPSP